MIDPMSIAGKSTGGAGWGRGAARVLSLAVVVLLGVLLWRYVVAINVLPENFGTVEPGKIYRSGKMTPAALAAVHRKHGIRTIIDLGTYEPGSVEERREQRTAEELGIRRYVFDLEGDATGNPNAYVQALRLMSDPELQPVLVHCGAGTERTGCAVVLYRRIVQGADIVKAFEEAQAFGHDPTRNPWVFKVLLEYRLAIEEAFQAGGQIPGVPALPEPVPEGQGAGEEISTAGRAGPAATAPAEREPGT